MAAKSKSRRQVIGNDPLDSLIAPRAPERQAPPARDVKPATAPPRETASRPAARRPTPEPIAVEVPKGRSVRATFHIPHDLLEEARNAVVALSGPPLRLTLAGVTQEALRKEIERLKKEHNQGKPFPSRAADLKGGRPIGS